VPNLKAIRSRIVSVKNTRKITRAMKLVAAARLRRAQENIVRMRPYALQTMDIIASLAARIADDEPHPLLARRPPERVLLVVLTSDRGLAGAFNAGISRAAFRSYGEYVQAGKQVTVATVGRKGGDFFRRRGVTIAHSLGHVYEQLSYEKAKVIGDLIIKEYTAKNLDAVYLCYNEFKSAVTQKIVIEQLLPIEPKQAAAEGGKEPTATEFIYEPDQKTLLDTLLPLYVHVEVYRALLESVASEHGARMTAMDNATNNAADMIQALTLQANRARQAAITTELMEIISGAEALKG
jgi:F-type H+-transporting ATPase subunit gamma